MIIEQINKINSSQAAAILKVSVRTVQRRAAKGLINALSSEGGYTFDKDYIESIADLSIIDEVDNSIPESVVIDKPKVSSYSPYYKVSDIQPNSGISIKKFRLYIREGKIPAEKNKLGAWIMISDLFTDDLISWLNITKAVRSTVQDRDLCGLSCVTKVEYTKVEDIPPVELSEWYSAKDVVAVAEYSRHALYSRVKSGNIKAYRAKGNAYIFKGSDLLPEWVNAGIQSTILKSDYPDESILQAGNVSYVPKFTDVPSASTIAGLVKAVSQSPSKETLNVVLPPDVEGLVENLSSLKVVTIGDLRFDDIQPSKDGFYSVGEIAAIMKKPYGEVALLVSNNLLFTAIGDTRYVEIEAVESFLHKMKVKDLDASKGIDVLRYATTGILYHLFRSQHAKTVHSLVYTRYSDNFGADIQKLYLKVLDRLALTAVKSAVDGYKAATVTLLKPSGIEYAASMVAKTF